MVKFFHLFKNYYLGISFAGIIAFVIQEIYDIVEGPMADDTIWDYVEDYMAGRISKAAFWELVKFKYPTHQIVFCTERALQTIKFEGSYSL